MNFEITEQWACAAPAGPELDRVCAEWMGLSLYPSITIEMDGDDHPVWASFDPGEFIGSPDPDHTFVSPSGYFGPGDHDALPPRFSTDWSAAGPLLEAMTIDSSRGPRGPMFERFGDCGLFTHTVSYFDGPNRTLVSTIDVEAETMPLAIARACAVLVSRGVTREEVGS